MAQRSKGREVRIRGHQRTDIDTDLMAQIVIHMGRQLAREARGEPAEDEPEILPVQPRERTA